MSDKLDGFWQWRKRVVRAYAYRDTVRASKSRPTTGPQRRRSGWSGIDGRKFNADALTSA